ncbi:protoheme IX farnesyltransferase [Acidilobus saccharovorans]|uniref:protoheme IX farnesyltransferase n=1 Tax=Acidilobus saccharovorans TaxID=242703 RepID=UPI0006620A58|nr:UbiA family prenyltransferase [Acidilobus saccharovorans]
MSILSKTRYVIEMMKPPQLGLLTFTAYSAYFAAGGSLDAIKLLLLAITSLGSIGGITALNMVLEADIDSVMDRTRKRPIPSGKLSHREGLAASLAMIAIGAAAALALNFYVLLAVLLAFLFDIPVYTILLKRRSPLNIIFGGIAGVMQVLGGWAAAAGSYSLAALFLALAVLAWIPMHIWFIVYYYYDDYRRARIPMYPVVASPRKVSAVVIGFLAVMLASMWLYWAVTSKGLLGDILLTPLTGMAAYKIYRFSSSPSKEAAKSIFILANPTLIVAFLFAPLAVPHAAAPLAQLGSLPLT